MLVLTIHLHYNRLKCKGISVTEALQEPADMRNETWHASHEATPREASAEKAEHV